MGSSLDGAFASNCESNRVFSRRLLVSAICLDVSTTSASFTADPRYHGRVELVVPIGSMIQR